MRIGIDMVSIVTTMSMLVAANTDECDAAEAFLWTAKRANHIREHIEGTFHCIQNTGCNLERLLAKTVHVLYLSHELLRLGGCHGSPQGRFGCCRGRCRLGGLCTPSFARPALSHTHTNGFSSLAK